MSVQAIVCSSILFDGTGTGIARPLGVEATKRERATKVQNDKINLLASHASADQAMIELRQVEVNLLQEKLSIQKELVRSTIAFQSAQVQAQQQKVQVLQQKVQALQAKVYFEAADKMGVPIELRRSRLNTYFDQIFTEPRH